VDEAKMSKLDSSLKAGGSSGKPLFDASKIAEEFAGIKSLEEFKAFILKKFYTAYGRYENASRSMFVEIEHDGTEDHDVGSVLWRKGIVKDTGESELTENETLAREKAIPRYMEAVEKGYSRVFEAITREDFEREAANQLAKQSPIRREGLLGNYYRGKEFFRLKEYAQGVYSVERGYDGSFTGGNHQLSEADARHELESALAEGFAREGAEADDGVFSFEGWGDMVEAEKTVTEPVLPEGAFNFEGFADMFKEDE
jgi:hypothetical protein